MGADPVACAALAAGAPVKAFFVRKEKKQHGLQRWIEGPELDDGERCLVVEDVVTTGGSTIKAIERIREDGLEIAGVVSVLDRLAGGGEAIETAAGGAPYTALTTIDDVYPEAGASRRASRRSAGARSSTAAPASARPRLARRPRSRRGRTSAPRRARRRPATGCLAPPER